MRYALALLCCGAVLGAAACTAEPHGETAVTAAPSSSARAQPPAGPDPTGPGTNPPATADATAPATAGAMPVAEQLIADTRAALVAWADVVAAEAAGYRTIGDGFTGHEHFVHPTWMLDERILDPQRPESLVYRVQDGQRELVSAMYVLPQGSTMADVPDLGDPRAVWHTHDDLCFDRSGLIAGRLVDGACVPRGVHLPTPPMMHVWIVDHPCGPFAGLDGHGEACATPHDH